MQKQFVSGVLLILSLVVVLPARAQTYCAGGAVTSVNTNGDGLMLATITNVGANLQLCNVRVKIGVWEPAACRSLQAMLLSAKLAGQKVAVWLGPTQSCTRAAWSNLTDGGFYSAMLY